MCSESTFVPANHNTNHIIKFANDTTLVGLITNEDELAYRHDAEMLMTWCNSHNLSVITEKNKTDDY